MLFRNMSTLGNEKSIDRVQSLLSLNVDFLLFIIWTCSFLWSLINIYVRGALLLETGSNLSAWSWWTKLTYSGWEFNPEVQGKKRLRVCVCVLELHSSGFIYLFIFNPSLINRKQKIQIHTFLSHSLDLDEHFSSRLNMLKNILWDCFWLQKIDLDSVECWRILVPMKDRATCVSSCTAL